MSYRDNHIKHYQTKIILITYFLIYVVRGVPNNKHYYEIEVMEKQNMLLWTILSRVTFALASYKVVLNKDITGWTLRYCKYNT